MSPRLLIATQPESDTWLLSPEDAARPLSLIVEQRRLTSVFPYMRFAWAEGDGNQIEIHFATHKVSVTGHGLAGLLAEIAEHRVIRLLEPSATEAKFAGSVGSCITGISVQSLAEESE